MGLGPLIVCAADSSGAFPIAPPLDIESFAKPKSICSIGKLHSDAVTIRDCTKIVQKGQFRSSPPVPLLHHQVTQIVLCLA